MESFIYFILGAAISIPVSIFAPFWTERYKQFRASSSKKRSAARKAQLESDLQLAVKLHGNPAVLAGFLLWRILLITLVTSVTGILQGLFPTFSFLMQLGERDYGLDVLANYASSICGVMGTAFVAGLCVRTIRLYRRVVDIDDYKGFVTASIDRLSTNSNNLNMQE